MTEELNLPCRYKVFRDSDSNTYYFQTDTGASYEISFIDGSLIFDATPLANLEISNIAIAKTRQGTGRRDINIWETVQAIVSDFFKVTDRILIYTCDSTDTKHYTRHRLFNSWFGKSNLKSEIIKLDADIKSQDGESMLTSMIYHSENSLGHNTITQTFEEVVLILQESKL